MSAGSSLASIDVPNVRRTAIGMLAWPSVLLPFLVLAVWRGTQGPDINADDYGQYLMHAAALAEGRPYTDIGYIFTPYNRMIGPLAAPPGLPLVLAPIMAILGDSRLVIGGFMLAMAAAFVVSAGVYFARTDGRALGCGVALLCGLSPAVIHASTQALTDLPFAAAIWAIIVIADHDGRWDWWRVIGVTVLGGWAILVRPLGITLIPALLAFAALRARNRGFRPVLPVALWVGCLLAALPILDVQRFSVVALDPGRVFNWLEYNRWGLRTLFAYRLAIFDSHLYPFPGDRMNDAFHIASALLMTIGLVAWVRRAGVRLAVVFSAIYGPLLLILPINQVRYAWPLFPVFIFGLLNGIRVVAGALSRESSRRSQGAIAIGAAIAIAIGGTVQAWSRPASETGLDRQEVHQLFEYIRSIAAREPVRVVFGKPRSLAWETGAAAMAPFNAPPECVLRELSAHRITHVVVREQDQAGEWAESLEWLTTHRPELFSEDHETATFTVLRFAAPVRQEPEPQTGCP